VARSAALILGAPPWPDANRLAHESIRDQMRQGRYRQRRRDSEALAQAYRSGLVAARREGPGEVEGLVPDKGVGSKSLTRLP